MKARAEILVSGRVQGVAFRRHTKELAERLRLTGWVRNLADGRVAICCEGLRCKVEVLAAWCRTGPERAAVSGVTVGLHSWRGEFQEFRVLTDSTPADMKNQTDVAPTLTLEG